MQSTNYLNLFVGYFQTASGTTVLQLSGTKELDTYANNLREGERDLLIEMEAFKTKNLLNIILDIAY